MSRQYASPVPANQFAQQSEPDVGRECTAAELTQRRLYAAISSAARAVNEINERLRGNTPQATAPDVVANSTGLLAAMDANAERAEILAKELQELGRLI